MSIKIEKTENNNELKLEFTIEAKKFDDAIMKVFNKSARYFNIPGFRKGKAPFNIVERMYGDEIFYEDAFNELVPAIYEKEIEDNKLDVVSKPEIDIVKMKKGEDLIFTAIVQTKPEVKLGKYKGVELKKVEYPVTDEDVEHEIAHMQEHNARTITADNRPVQEKDIAVIDFEGFVDGKPFEGGKAENHELEIGSGAFIPGFEEQVIGMKTGEEKEIKEAQKMLIKRLIYGVVIFFVVTIVQVVFNLIGRSVVEDDAACWACATSPSGQVCKDAVNKAQNQ